MRIGVDTGGTFTDLIAVGEDGALFRAKIPSTPDDPARAVLEALERVRREAGRSPEGVAHGSTVATNALLERRGARVVLLTTEGFEDVLEIRRQSRPELHALEPALPPPLVPAGRRLGLPERLGPHGEVLRALTLDEDEAAQLRDRLRSLGAEAVAVVLLHAYANGEHEARVAEALAGLDLPLTLSHRLSPEIREYERSSTCVANAFVAPTCQRYLARVDEALAAASDAGALAPTRLTVLRSDGGVRASASARVAPVHTALSGPAGGVTGAARVARQAGLSRVLTLDMGGTSTDVCVVVEGTPLRRDQIEIGELPLRIPALDIYTVGAGGGSLAWIDGGGALRVGPRSAGADPGPAAYGRGGEEPTLTDAHLVLGRLPPDLLLGGELPLDLEAARRAVAGLGARLGLDAEACAAGIVRVAGAVMARALRRVSLERGHDPRDFVLMPFGGAGGLHAAELAELLEIPEVVVPPEPGLLCAYGALAARRRDLRRRTLQLPLPAERGPADAPLAGQLASAYAELEARARAALAAEGEAHPELEATAELRYRGQSATLEVPVEPASATLVADAAAAFARRHAEAFGFTLPRPLEWVTARVEARGRAPEVPAPLVSAGSARTISGGAGVTARREELGPGSLVEGPAAIVERTGTTWVPAGFRARVDALGLLRLGRRP
ncbi:MAG: hydantoinase/oxoprolinase family protein [Deltaproteobacteria bacterium]|nr:hydantoinase/oxoprolinase family protein [Deltaproteobacteria bacterium]